VHVVTDDGRKFPAYYERDGVVTGVVGGGMPGKVMKTRQDRRRRADRRRPGLTICASVPKMPTFVGVSPADAHARGQRRQRTDQNWPR
jgi:hypothetical protein